MKYDIPFLLGFALLIYALYTFVSPASAVFTLSIGVMLISLIAAAGAEERDEQRKGGSR